MVDGQSVGPVAEHTFYDVRENHTIHATFSLLEYVITATAAVGGSIDPEGQVGVDCGDDQAFTIAPDECYEIEDVVVDGQSVGPVAEHTFYDVRENHTIHATFSLLEYEITATAGPGGTIDPEGQVGVDCGEDQAFTIAPDDCYEIEDVVVDGQSVGPVAEHTFYDVQENHTIHATFSLLGPYTITATAGPGGTIDPSGEVAVDCGDDQAFTIIPDDCHDIEDVVVDGQSVGPVVEYTFYDVQENHTIHATFVVALTRVVVATAGPGGTIDPSGEVEVDCGDDQAFTVTPDECYGIDDVLVDGESVGPVGEYTFLGVTQNHTIHVVFDFECYAFEHGTVVANHRWTTVRFSEQFGSPPVVVAGPATSKDRAPGVVRIRKVTKRSFQIRFQEWDYLDGKHKKEAIRWAAAQPGVWHLLGGGKLVVGKFRTACTNARKPRRTRFPERFVKDPVVLAQVQTTRGANAVTDRICRVANGEFRMALQEQESGGGHPWEVVGYFAVTSGATDLGGSPCAVGVTKKEVTHKDFGIVTPIGSCKVFVEEERSLDGETRHRTERVGYIALGGTPLLVADMQTCAESDTATVRYRKTLKGGSSCQLAVSAQDECGEGLAGAVILASAQDQQQPLVIVTGAGPAVQGYGPATVVTLEAQGSVADGTRLLEFDRWEVDGVAMTTGDPVVQIEMRSDRSAAAVYGKAP